MESMRLAIYAVAPIPAPLIKQVAERLTPNVQLATGQTEMYTGTMTFKPLAHPGMAGVGVVGRPPAVAPTDDGVNANRSPVTVLLFCAAFRKPDVAVSLAALPT